MSLQRNFMKKLSGLTRKMLRKLYLVFGATTISLLFVACYGMPLDSLEDCTSSHYNQEETTSEEQTD